MSKLPIARLTNIRFHIVAVFLLFFAAGEVRSAETSAPVVRAVLFASPTCAHCTKVKEEVLPPLVARYGSKLQIAILSIDTESGSELFLSACMKYGHLSQSVPFLILGNTAMVGSKEIPSKFPELIEKYIAEGGVDWPGIPGLSAMLAARPEFAPNVPQHAEPSSAAHATVTPEPEAAAAKPQPKPSLVRETETAESRSKQPTTTAAPEPVPASTSRPQTSESAGAVSVANNTAAPSIPPASADASAGAGTATSSPAVKAEPSGIIDLTGGETKSGILTRIKRDIYGNGLAILVLAGMILTVLASPAISKKEKFANSAAIRPRYDWLIPLLTLAGIAVAAYLSHVEVSQVEAVCGPVGDCNTVNQSEYAKLFGILPIGVLGLIGFFSILATWTIRRLGSRRIQHCASIGILGMTCFGTLFSIYLTFLEPFVIGATCLWCLSSAMIMTTLYALSLKPGRQAWSALKIR